MRILLLTSEYTADGGGDIARYIAHSSALLVRAGHDVTILAPGQAAAIEHPTPGLRIIWIVSHHDRPSGLKRYFQRPTRAGTTLCDTISYWPALSYQFAQTVQGLIDSGEPPPDLIECQDYGALGYYLLQQRLLDNRAFSKTAIVITAHGPLFELDRANQAPRFKFPAYWVGQMEKFCLLAADGIISPSRYMAECAERALDRRLPITVIPYPYACDELPLSTPASGEIMYVGALEVRNGALPLLRACSRLWAAGTDFRLTLIGRDSYYYPRATAMIAFIRRKYMNAVQAGRLSILEDLPPAVLRQRLARAWAVIAPATWDNYPYSCIEALACGKLVLMSTSGGQREMLADGAEGLLFDWEVEGSFEGALNRAFALSQAENQAIGRRAAQHIRALTAYAELLPQREAAFQQALARAAEPRTLFPTLLTTPPPPMPIESDSIPGLLSVVIPFYNLGPYIEETLASALAQDYAPLEVIIVDDGSDQPASLAALERIRAAGHPHVRILSTANQGLSAARNTGAAAARGEFLAFLDADDLLAPNFCGRAIAVLRRYTNVGFVSAWIRAFGGKEGIGPTWNAEFPFLLGANMLCPLAVVRRGLFLTYGKNRPILEYGLEDHDTWLSLVASGAVGVSIPEPLVSYRIRPESMYRQMNEEQMLYLYDLIVQHHSDLYREYGPELFMLQNANGPSYQWQHPATQSVTMQLRRALWNARNRLMNLRLLVRRQLRWLRLLRLPKALMGKGSFPQQRGKSHWK